MPGRHAPDKVISLGVRSTREDSHWQGIAFKPLTINIRLTRSRFPDLVVAIESSPIGFASSSANFSTTSLFTNPDHLLYTGIPNIDWLPSDPSHSQSLV
jgi:hypothetical protein